MARIATVKRITAETQITLTLNIDGKGVCNVKNPIGFFDHLLSCFCKHGMFDLDGQISGDLYTDQHHTIEDTGIVLGECFSKALGSYAGIYRTGSSLFPMDEALLQAAVDFSGRSYVVCEPELSGFPLVSSDGSGKVYSFQTDCFNDFWIAFAQHAKCNIHLVTLRGRSDHHKMEGLFKAAAKAIREAAAIDERRGGDLPSTKNLIDV